MSKYVLTGADIEKISFKPGNDYVGKRSVKGKLSTIYRADNYLTMDAIFSAKSFTLECITYTPEEISEVSLKIIFKGLLIKVKNKFKRREKND